MSYKFVFVICGSFFCNLVICFRTNSIFRLVKTLQQSLNVWIRFEDGSSHKIPAKWLRQKELFVCDVVLFCFLYLSGCFGFSNLYTPSRRFVIEIRIDCRFNTNNLELWGTLKMIISNFIHWQNFCFWHNIMNLYI